MELRVRDKIGHAVTLHIHAINLPIGCLQNPFGKMVAYKAVYAQNKYFFHDFYNMGILPHCLNPTNKNAARVLDEFL